MAADLGTWQGRRYTADDLCIQEVRPGALVQFPKYAPKSRRPGGKSQVTAALGVVCKTVGHRWNVAA